MNVNHAVGGYQDRLIGETIAKRRGEWLWLMRELVGEIERRVVPVRLHREVERKEIPAETLSC